MRPLTVLGEVEGKGVKVVWNPGGLIEAHPRVDIYLQAVASTIDVTDNLPVYPGGPSIKADDLFGSPEGFLALCNRAFKVLSIEGWERKTPEGVWT